MMHDFSNGHFSHPLPDPFLPALDQPCAQGDFRASFRLSLSADMLALLSPSRRNTRSAARLVARHFSDHALPPLEWIRSRSRTASQAVPFS